MEHVKTGIILENKKHSEDLIRRLAEIAPGMEFSEGEAGDFTITEDIAAEYFPVGLLVQKMAAELGTRFTSLMRDMDSRRVRTYVVRSRCGGSGCTSLGLTIARILAGRSGGRVAFVTDDTGIYTENKPMRSSREFIYMLNHGITAEAARYAAEDGYGVFIFEAGTEINMAAEWLYDQEFSAVVADAGSNSAGRILAGQAIINVEREGDRRAENFESSAAAEIEEGSREFYVLNAAPYSSTEGRFVKIPYDETSFICREKKIEIALDREYASAVGELISMVEKELDDGQSDFYK